MNEYVVTALAILISMGIGFLLLIEFGVSWVGYFVIAVITLSIVGSYFYAWWKTQSDKTVSKLKIEILVKMKNELQDMDKVISRAESLVKVKSFKQDLDMLVNNLIKLKFYNREFKLSPGVEKYTLTFVEQQGRMTEQKLRTLGAMAAGNYRPKLDEYVDGLRSKLEMLLVAGYDIENDLESFNASANQPSKSLRELVGKKEGLDLTMLKTLEKCVGEAARLAVTSKEFGDTSNVEKEINNIDQSSFESSVSHLVTARESIKGILNDAFVSQHTKLLTNAKRVQSIMQSENVGAAQRKGIEEMRDTLESMNDPGRILEIKDLEVQFKTYTTNAIESIYQKIGKLEESIKIHQPDDRIWTLNMEIPTLVEMVDISKKIDEFSRDSINTLHALVHQLDIDEAFMKIIENYQKVEPIIARKLEEKGKVTEDDLKVKYVEKFLLLYSLKYPEVKYKKDQLTLPKKSKRTTKKVTKKATRKTKKPKKR
jgi:hypothetical protein